MIPQAWLQSGLLLVVAALVTMLCVPFAGWLAQKTGAIDYPSARRVNTRPIPRLGGVAMFLGMIAALLVLALGIFCLNWETPFGYHAVLDDIKYFWLGVSVLIMFLVGLADDIKSLNPKVKLLGQLVAAGVAAASGLLLVGLEISGTFYSFGWWAYPITMLYLVAFANIINLIDGLDGLASGITAISALSIMVLSLLVNQPAAAFLCAALIGVCLGFLRYNFNPASIFMGDCGALTLGFCLGCVSLLAIVKSSLVVSLLVPILAAGVPVLDTAAAIIRRIRGHRPIDEADKGHLHHRLLGKGNSQRRTVLIMWGWTAVLAGLGIALVLTSGWVRWVVIAAVVAMAVIIVLRYKVMRPVQVHGYDGSRKEEAGENGENGENGEGTAPEGDASAGGPEGEQRGTEE